MALDFSKLTAAVKSVAELAASHANVSALAADAKAFAASVEDKVRAEYAVLENAAQSELDSITAAIETALASNQPLTHAEAVGVTAVAVALSDPSVAAPAPVSVSPTQPAVPAPVAPDPVAPVAVGLMAVTTATAAPPAPQTVEEYNAMRAAGLIP